MLTNKRGFILMEVISSVLILSICAVAILFAVTTSTYRLAGAMQRLKAVELAHGKLEEIMGLEFENIASVPKTDYPEFFGEYQYAVDVQNDVEYSKFLKNINVTVYFTEPVSGLEKSITIAGARAKR
ncbi:hypothetical protein SPSYN_00276 [Sporotomaculum syntrophicum]|uniref:Prepilin-type N-terminal cleavage/methylation domain-containing protein n=1 Tax=Sporotomaculum syntrophicum TaxID=182264 RepID=A0A9D2WTX3_9FIRM|nr:type II secretion system protein [Sporotomaculum syntrophicum]KAF1086557.1 hypothetical protein SPSYN_00276 [Sporotomaculum syntrophicum]